MSSGEGWLFGVCLVLHELLCFCSFGFCMLVFIVTRLFDLFNGL